MCEKRIFFTSKKRPRARPPSSVVGWKRLKHATRVDPKNSENIFLTKIDLDTAQNEPDEVSLKLRSVGGILDKSDWGHSICTYADHEKFSQMCTAASRSIFSVHFSVLR